MQKGKPRAVIGARMVIGRGVGLHAAAELLPGAPACDPGRARVLAHDEPGVRPRVTPEARHRVERGAECLALPLGVDELRQLGEPAAAIGRVDSSKLSGSSDESGHVLSMALT